MTDRLQMYSVNHWLEFRRRFPRSVSVNDTTQHHLHHYTTNEHLFGKMPKYKGTDWAHILGGVLVKYYVQLDNDENDMPEVPEVKPWETRLDHVEFQTTTIPLGWYVKQRFNSASRSVNSEIGRYLSDSLNLLLFTDGSVGKEGDTGNGGYLVRGEVGDESFFYSLNRQTGITIKPTN